MKLLFKIPKKLFLTSCLIVIAPFFSFAQANQVFSPPLKESFVISDDTAARWCYEQNISWNGHEILSSSTAVSQSVAIRIDDTWVLSFPNDVNTKVDSLRCYSAGPMLAGTRLGWPVIGTNEAASQLCKEAGYSSGVIATSFNYPGTPYAIWNAFSNSWVVISGVPLAFGPSIASTILCAP